MNAFLLKRIHIFMVILMAPLCMHAMEGTKDVKRAKVDRNELTNACTLYSTLNENVIGSIILDIRSAQKNEYVGIESPNLSNALIIREIKNAALRGVMITIFTDPQSNQHLQKEFEGINIVVKSYDKIHAKRIIIRAAEPILWIGSMNLSERATENIELMVRCTDPHIVYESYKAQKSPDLVHSIAPNSINFDLRSIMNSNNQESIAQKIRTIKEFSACSHPHDFLYFVSFTLDNAEIEKALIDTAQKTKKPITIILDAHSWENHKLRSSLKKLVVAGANVYIYNKNGTIKNRFGGNKYMHIKAILSKCNQNCLSLISTANFTPTGKSDINVDLWEPCSLNFAQDLQTIFLTILPHCQKLSLESFPQELDARTSVQKGLQLWELMKYNDIIYGNRESIIRLIHEGADVNVTKEDLGTLLMRAVSAEQEEIVHELLQAGAHVNEAVESQTALQIAAQNGNVEILKMLLAEPGIEVNRANQYGSTPLYLASGSGKVNVVKLLLSAGADPNLDGEFRIYKNSSGSIPPILQAVKHGHIEIVQELLKYKADINATDPEGINALIFSCIHSKIPLIKLLAAHGANLNVLNPKTQKTLITDAINRLDDNTLTIINILLSQGADVNTKDKMGKSAMFYVEQALDRTKKQPALYRKYLKIKEVLEAHLLLRNNPDLMSNRDTEITICS